MKILTKKQLNALQKQPFIPLIKGGRAYLSKHYYIDRDGKLKKENE